MNEKKAAKVYMKRLPVNGSLQWDLVFCLLSCSYLWAPQQKVFPASESRWRCTPDSPIP